jgi:hypothetical protein
MKDIYLMIGLSHLVNLSLIARSENRGNGRLGQGECAPAVRRYSGSRRCRCWWMICNVSIPAFLKSFLRRWRVLAGSVRNGDEPQNHVVRSEDLDSLRG